MRKRMPKGILFLWVLVYSGLGIKKLQAIGLQFKSPKRKFI